MALGPFDPIGLAAKLAELVASPRVQYLSNKVRATTPWKSDPFGTNIPKITPSARAGASPGQIGSGIGSGAGTLVNRFASLLGKGGPQGQQEDPMLTLYNQLIEQLQQPVAGPTGIDTQNLMQQIKDAINPIYDQRMQAAQTRSASGRKEVEQMYRALSNDYERLAPEQVAQAQAAQEEIKQLYGQLRSNIEGDYSRVSSEQSELFKQLGIEAAAPDVLEDQQAQVNQAMTAASENQAQQQQRYMDMGQADATYYREGSPNATMTGNEIRTDMLSDLETYLQQIEAERSSGIQSAYMDQLGQANSLLAQQQQSAQSEAARRQEMLWNILQSQMQNSQQKALNPDTFMSGLPSKIQNSVAQAFTQLQRTPEAIYNKVKDPRDPAQGFVPTTPQWFMSQADEMLKSGQITPEEHQALLMYIQLYYGTGK